MASVTIDQLRSLAAFRASVGCAVSLYVNLDPSAAPTAGDAQTRFNSAISEAEKAEAANREDLTHDQKTHLRADFERMRSYFDNDFDRDGAQGLALFASGGDDFWFPLPLPAAVDESTSIGKSFHLAPLVRLLGDGDGAIVAVVGRERGDVYRYRGGRLVEVADHTEDAPRRHDQGGWSQARFQRHIDELAADHMRTIAEEVDRRIRRGNGAPLVVVCAEETRSQFAELLSSESQAALAGWAQVESHAGPDDVLEAVRPALEEARVRHEDAILERWREEAGRGGRASSGWQETLEAVSDARVDVLLFDEAANREAFTCPECGRASASGGECPLDGTPFEREENGVDVAVHRALANGGSLLALRDRPDLGPAEGIAAILRF